VPETVYVLPRVLQRIVKRALVGPDRITASTGAVVFSTFHDHPPVGQHGRTKIQWGVAARERGDLRPSAVDVAAAAVGREFVPRTVVVGCAGSKIAFLMPDLPAVRLGSQAFGVCGSFAKCGLA